MSRSDDCDDSLQWHSGISKNWQQTDRYPTAVDGRKRRKRRPRQRSPNPVRDQRQGLVSGSSLDIEDVN